MTAQVMINTGNYTEAEVLDALKFLIQNKQCADITTTELAEYLFQFKS